MGGNLLSLGVVTMGNLTLYRVCCKLGLHIYIAYVNSLSQLISAGGPLFLHTRKKEKFPMFSTD
jgi:hypothetical protein